MIVELYVMSLFACELVSCTEQKTNCEVCHQFVTNLELENICYKEPYRGSSDCFDTCGHQEIKNTDVRNYIEWMDD